MNEWNFVIHTPQWPLYVFLVVILLLIVGLYLLYRWWRQTISYKINDLRYNKRHLIPYSKNTLKLILGDGSVIGKIYRKYDYGIELESGYTFVDDGETVRGNIVKNQEINLVDGSGGISSFQRLDK